MVFTPSLILQLSYNLAGRKEVDMARKRYSPEQIISMLREVEVIQLNSGSGNIIGIDPIVLWVTSHQHQRPLNSEI